jgi:sulfatase maturation enzyme AslB (radical SAM superfamily)
LAEIAKAEYIEANYKNVGISAEILANGLTVDSSIADIVKIYGFDIRGSADNPLIIKF